MYQVMHKVKTVCGWCNAPMGTTISTAPNPNTHGICTTCQKALNVEALKIKSKDDKAKA